MIPRGEVIGIDISTDILEFGKKNIVREKINNVKLIEFDAHEMDFKNKFDAVYSNITLDRCHDLGTIISLIYKAFKVNGRIMLCIPKGS